MVTEAIWLRKRNGIHLNQLVIQNRIPILILLLLTHLPKLKVAISLTPRDLYRYGYLNTSDFLLQLCHVWLNDSGCTSHMAGRRGFLSNYVEKEGGRVKFGGKDRGTIRGYGWLTNGKITIKNVKYVEGLDYNLLSSHQLSRSGYLVTTFVMGCYVKDEDGRVIIRGREWHGLYACKEKIYLLSKASKEDSWLWYHRLSHQNFKDMNKLVSKKLVVGLPELCLGKDALCPACAQGKMKRSSHMAKIDTNCSHPLDMIHMDLCGPMCVQSINGKKYILVLIDEYSHYTWVEFLRAKFEAADTIILFIKRVQRLMDRKIKKL
ncbi:hypothetical protein OSB04_011992 [Centaurea solstitialis]|uniref:GAG-pre-integrase domain-containing protein n=1 Tax=Centaurea solstitialis TaxID=347529 RepID=A0AA38TVA7_9ASTR|nr:hypothetical protein OSB04_011992 [Centaurea solstitialis]